MILVGILDVAYKDYVEVKYALEPKKVVNSYLKDLTYPSFKTSAGINSSLFKILAGDEVDLDGDSIKYFELVNKENISDVGSFVQNTIQLPGL